MAGQLRNWHCLSIVMPGLVAGIHLLLLDTAEDVDAARPIWHPAWRTPTIHVLDGRLMAGHDGSLESISRSGLFVAVMAGLVPAIHVLLY